MLIEDIDFQNNNGVMYVAPTGVRILSRCIASSEYSCTFRYFAALNVNPDILKQVIVKMCNSTTTYESSDKQIVMQTSTEHDAFNGLITTDNIMAVGEIDMTNHVITSTADFTEVYVHLPNRFGTKSIFMNDESEIVLDITDSRYCTDDTYESFKEYCETGTDFKFNALAIYLNISDGDNTYNSLYGIYIPNKDANTIDKYAYAQAGTIVQSGNSFGFRINLRLVEDTDNSGSAGTVLTNIDDKTNSFSMSMFTDALARMQMVLTEHKDLAEKYASLYDDVQNLQALCDTGTTIAALAEKVNKLSEYVDNYMLAIEDKDSLLNMIANINKQMQSFINGEVGPEINVKMPIQAGEGIYFNSSNDTSIINNANERYHIDQDNIFDNGTTKVNVRNFAPTTFSNIIPVFSRSTQLNTNMVLTLDPSLALSSFKFRKGQSFQFVIASDVKWNGYGCELKVGSRTINTFTKDDIQCARPIFEIICTDAPEDNNGEHSGTLNQCSFWARCINPKYDGSTNNTSNIIPVTYKEAVELCNTGSILLDKLYYLTDYEFLPGDNTFSNINSDITISIYLHPVNKTTFDNRVFMSISSASDGSQTYSWGDYYLMLDDDRVDSKSMLSKGYITNLNYGAVTANYDFIHCGVSKNAISTSFRNRSDLFLQDLQGGSYDSWITSVTQSSSICSIKNNTDAIDSQYKSDDYYPSIDINSNSDVYVTDHNMAIFKLPIMHISNCEDLCIHDCDKILLYGVNHSAVTRSNDVMIKASNHIEMTCCDNIRIYATSHSITEHAFNTWIYSSENVNIQNATAILLDGHKGSIISGVTGNSIIILRYTSNVGQKAILNNISDGCMILDNLNSDMTSTFDSWRLICNRYDALCAQSSTGSTNHDYYVVKRIIYLDESEGTSEDIKKEKITQSNITNLI